MCDAPTWLTSAEPVVCEMGRKDSLCSVSKMPAGRRKAASGGSAVNGCAGTGTAQPLKQLPCSCLMLLSTSWREHTFWGQKGGHQPRHDLNCRANSPPEQSHSRMSDATASLEPRAPQRGLEQPP